MNTYVIVSDHYETELRADKVEYNAQIGCYEFSDSSGVVGFAPLTATIVKAEEED